MLYIVLILVLAALGLLITALITASSTWAWISIGLSVAAGLVLIFDWVRRRRAGAQAAEDAEPASETTVVGQSEQGEPAAAVPAGEERAAAEAVPDKQPAAADEETMTVPAGPPDTSGSPAEDDLDSFPAEEDTDAADLLIVCDLDDQVIVVDEYPRYHLLGCSWLVDRDTIPIAIAEARELGFTPCAMCGPDAVLAAGHRNRVSKLR
ncbi:MAG: hypothetical protein ACRDQ7_24000 [Haloechinothrix sp.]